MKKITFIFLVIVFIAGCNSPMPTQQALSLIIAGTNVAYEFENGIKAKFLDQVQLTEEENKIISKSLSMLNDSKYRLRTYKNNSLQLITKINEIDMEAEIIRQNYMNIYNIILSNWNRYTPTTQNEFKKFHESAVVLDKEFTKMIKSINSDERINRVLSIADTALKLAVLL